MINALTWSFGLSAFFHTLFHALNSQMRHRFASIFSLEPMQPPTSTGYPKLLTFGRDKPDCKRHQCLVREGEESLFLFERTYKWCYAKRNADLEGLWWLIIWRIEFHQVLLLYWFTTVDVNKPLSFRLNHSCSKDSVRLHNYHVWRWCQTSFQDKI